jgi:hypothetical protein
MWRTGRHQENSVTGKTNDLSLDTTAMRQAHVAMITDCSLYPDGL